MTDQTGKAHALELARVHWGGDVEGERLMPIGAHLGTLADAAEPICRAAGEWHAICAEPRQHELACEQIAARGLPVYAPMLWLNERHGRGGTRTVQRPMFGPYMFVRCVDTADEWPRITSARGVARLLKTSTGSMAVVPDEAIDRMRLHESDSALEYERMRRAAAEDRARELEEVARRDAAKSAQELEAARRIAARDIVWHFSPEQVVRIKSGPFAGFSAKLEAAVDENARIAALVDVFRCPTKTNLSAFDIEAP